MDAALSRALDLHGRTAIVTGAGGGLGRGIALALAGAGANVMIAARRRLTGDETRALIEREGGRAVVVQTDVGVRADVERCIDATLTAFGALHIVVHNAASGLSGVPARLTDLIEANWHEQTRISLDGLFFLARASYPHLCAHRQGRFIVLSSGQAVTGGSMNPAYTAVKAGQRGFVRALAREWGCRGITVNAVLPAGLTEAAEAHMRRHPTLVALIKKQNPMAHLGDPRSEIGAAIVGLASDAGCYVNGQSLAVDGGIITL
jgi:NAD(P)-dependent dehydrogenase (short-subunit alcohol dehydrogenase family)